MTTITAKTDTFLKKFPKDSTELSDGQVHLVQAGTGFRVKAINPKLTEGHNYITFDEPIGANDYNSRYTWYIWMPDWSVVEDTRSPAKESTFYDVEADEFYPVAKIDVNKGADVLDENHLYLGIKNFTEELDS